MAAADASEDVPMPTTPESASANRDTAGVIAPPPLIYVGGLAIGFLLESLVPGSSLPSIVRFGLGGIVLIAGLALMA